MMLPSSRLLVRLGVVVAFVALTSTAYITLAATDRATGQPGRFSAYYEDDDGASEWRQLAQAERYDVTAVLSTPRLLDEYDDASRMAWVVFGLESVYGADEIDAIHGFLGRGGSVLIADTSGLANPLLAHMSVQFGPSRLLDERFEGNLSFIAADGTLGASTFRLVLNNPVSLLPDDSFQGQILVASSDSSYLDVNGNQAVDAADVPGPFPVAALWQTPAGGRIALVADVALFLNAGMRNPDFEHEAFQRAFLIEFLPDGGTLLVDESMHDHDRQVHAFARASDAAVDLARGPWTAGALGVLAAGLAILPVAVASTQSWRRHEPTIQRRALTAGQDGARSTLRHAARQLLANHLSTDAETLASKNEAELARMGADRLLAKAAAGGDLTEDETRQLSQRIQNEYNRETTA